MKTKRPGLRLDTVGDLFQPLAGVTLKGVRIIVDLKQQVIRFKVPGEAWRSVAIWHIADSLGAFDSTYVANDGDWLDPNNWQETPPRFNKRKRRSK